MNVLPLLFALTAACHAHGLLPDPRCTPGLADTTDIQVICQTSTESRRHVSRNTKRDVLKSYGIPWSERRHYEIDHLVPLEVGGSNDVGNLWAEPIKAAQQKDVAENRAHRWICVEHRPVESVQKLFRIDWRAVLQ